MRASVAAETVGIPTVTIVCEGFQTQAAATARGLGFNNLPLAVLKGHVDAQSSEAMIQLFLEFTCEQIIRALVNSAANEAVGDGPITLEPAAWEVVTTGTLSEVNQHFIEHGWSDGSPFVPPTIEAVEALIATVGYDPFRSLGVVRPSGRDLTIWSIAVNAVMAGCADELLPVLVAIAEVLVNPAYGVEHSGNTTGADALIVLSGPAGADLGFNSAQGAMREGSPANTTVARWLRLMLRNVFGFTSGEHDKATFGNSARVVLAEDHQALQEMGWPSLADDVNARLVPPESRSSSVSLARFNSSILIGSVFGSSPERIIPYLADGLVRATGWDLTHVFGLGRGHYQPLLVLSPLLAHTFANAGWSKADVREALFAEARIPAWKFEAFIGKWSNLTAGEPRLFDLARSGEVPLVFGESEDPSRLVPIVTTAEKFMIAVSGDRNRANALALANDGPHGFWTTKAIDFSPSRDLVCKVD
jgi:hypothetical protein